MIKTIRSRKAIALTTLLSLAMYSAATPAGEKLSYPVAVDLTQRMANGDLSTARSGSIYDTKSRIGCTVNSENSVTCHATTSSGTTATCQKYQAEQAMVNAVMALASDGYVAFRWDTAGMCTYVLTEKSSRWAPKR